MFNKNWKRDKERSKHHILAPSEEKNPSSEVKDVSLGGRSKAAEWEGW